MTKQAAYISTNAYDMILVPDGSFITVGKQEFADFLDPGDFNDWDGPDRWDDYAETMDGAIEEFTKHMDNASEGDQSRLLAYYEDGKLIIVDAQRFEQQRALYLGE